MVVTATYPTPLSLNLQSLEECIGCLLGPRPRCLCPLLLARNGVRLNLWNIRRVIQARSVLVHHKCLSSDEGIPQFRSKVDGGKDESGTVGEHESRGVPFSWHEYTVTAALVSLHSKRKSDPTWRV